MMSACHRSSLGRNDRSRLALVQLRISLDRQLAWTANGSLPPRDTEANHEFAWAR